MRLRTIGLAAALTAALIQTSSAVVQPKGAEAPYVAAGKAPRAQRTTDWSRASVMASLGLPGWTAQLDSDTRVPLRMWGPGVFTAGSVADPAIAESAARQFLERHIGLLAPGSSISDFEVVGNATSPDGEIRSVGFAQRAGGIRVLGGAVGFSFKKDRLVMVGSTALPGVRIAARPPTRLGTQKIDESAIGWLAGEGHTVAVRARQADRVIVPIVHPRRTGSPDIEYVLAEQVSVQSTTDEGRWDVWLDAETGAPVLRKTTIMYASGKVLFDVPDRHPNGTRGPKPAPQARHTVDGTQVVSEVDGTVTWATAANAAIGPGLTGPIVSITNRAGSLAADSLSLADGGTVTWSKATEEFADAQLSSFVFASTAKAYARTYLNPTLPMLGEMLPVNVNINQTCNANYDGENINFYRSTQPSPTGQATMQCMNTGRLADVVYHEFGHALHHHSIIDGVGAFDGSLSEGVSDMLAAFITDDHGMGRGFFLTDAPLRELDPSRPLQWPEDATGEVHDEGEIIGGALWRLKTALVAQYGAEVGNEKARKIFYGILQRASDIPSTFAEALVSDDDDGNLANGTPNMCIINNAFGMHGLASPEISLGLTPPARDAFKISMTISPPEGQAACPGAATVESAKVEWRKRDGELKTLALDAADTLYTGSIPTQPDGTLVEYKVTVTLSDGNSISYPNNEADPYYQFYVGDVEKLWCADFEAGADDWTHGADPSTRDEWMVGQPMGLGGDPKTAHGGQNVLGMDLATDGLYRRNVTSWAETPEIDLAGKTNVRLQYYRWLGVEDGFFDNAKILVNGMPMWSNFASPTETMNGKNHIDREWQFHDLDLTAQAATGKVKVRFELASDPGFGLAGWNLDDVCIVAAAAAPTCGNGSLDEGETCDDGNIDDGDDCSATCELPGVGGSDDTGCCSVGATPGGAAFLSLFTLGALLRRRRRG